jgi:hypothetical protein
MKIQDKILKAVFKGLTAVVNPECIQVGTRAVTTAAGVNSEFQLTFSQPFKNIPLVFPIKVINGSTGRYFDVTLKTSEKGRSIINFNNGSGISGIVSVHWIALDLSQPLLKISGGGNV